MVITSTNISSKIEEVLVSMQQRLNAVPTIPSLNKAQINQRITQIDKEKKVLNDIATFISESRISQVVDKYIDKDNYNISETAVIYLNEEKELWLEIITIRETEQLKLVQKDKSKESLFEKMKSIFSIKHLFASPRTIEQLQQLITGMIKKEIHQLESVMH